MNKPTANAVSFKAVAPNGTLLSEVTINDWIHKLSQTKMVLIHAHNDNGGDTTSMVNPRIKQIRVHPPPMFKGQEQWHTAGVPQTERRIKTLY